tara:strand:+ start:15391 stop:16416 length:1026 start_codon:yes stop_codon:yes gene_type:complete
MADDLRSTEPLGCPAPLRIATIGISPDAVFHLETAAIRDELIPIAAARTDDAESPDDPVPGCSVCSIDELLKRSDVDVVFVGGPIESRVDNAVRVLQAGRHVVVEPSSFFRPENLQRLISEAAATGKLCKVWRPHDADPDFRRACKVVASGEAGPVRNLRFLQHDMAAALLPSLSDNDQTSRDRLTSSTLRDLAAHRIAQALSLADASVMDIVATFRSDTLVLGERDSVRPVTPAGDTSFHAVIHFANDVVAIVDIGLACPAPYSTGWIMQGNQGGYHSGRQYITVNDGEIYDVAVEVEPFDPYLNLGAVLRSRPNSELQNRCLDELQAELELAKLFETIP